METLGCRSHESRQATTCSSIYVEFNTSLYVFPQLLFLKNSIEFSDLGKFKRNPKDLLLKKHCCKTKLTNDYLRYSHYNSTKSINDNKRQLLEVIVINMFLRFRLYIHSFLWSVKF